MPRAALALDPTHVLVIQFVRLLEAKLSLGELTACSLNSRLTGV